MSPKDKAEELVNKYLMTTPVGFHIDDAKQCSLIAVEEILDQFKWRPSNGLSYWEEVKTEIEKL